MKHSLLFSSGLALLLAVALPGRAPAITALAPGQAAPAFDLPTGDGRSLSLASLKGKVVLVDFWASWCGPCATAFPALENLFQEYRSRGFEVMAINLDEKRADAERFLADRPHAMSVVFDSGGKAARAFGLEGMPTSYLLGRDGRVRFVHVGYTPGAIENYRREVEQLLNEGQ